MIIIRQKEFNFNPSYEGRKKLVKATREIIKTLHNRRKSSKKK